MKPIVRNFILLLTIVGLSNAGCDSDDPSESEIRQKELERVKAATEKYHDVEAAKADGYVDINLVMPNMGAHFLKEELVDDQFDVDKPELLVYSPAADGMFILTAVEYAIPVDLSPNAPEGFAGANDIWVINTDFNLWVLHAWIWYENPEGIFNGTNPRVP